LEIFTNKGAPLVLTTPASYFITGTAGVGTGVVDPGVKFATGVIDTGGKFATGVNDTGGKLPQVSTTLAVYLPPMSMTLVASNGNNIRLLTP
jgi:hypothetical protein